MRRCVDANVILRYLLGDVPEQSELARQAIERGVYLHVDVLAEVVYVLEGVYGMPRAELATLLTEFLGEVGSDCRMTMAMALSIYANKAKLDFVDCLLAARHQIEGDEVITFDKQLNRYLESHSTQAYPSHLG